MEAVQATVVVAGAVTWEHRQRQDACLILREPWRNLPAVEACRPIHRVLALRELGERLHRPVYMHFQHLHVCRLWDRLVMGGSYRTMVMIPSCEYLRHSWVLPAEDLYHLVHHLIPTNQSEVSIQTPSFRLTRFGLLRNLTCLLLRVEQRLFQSGIVLPRPPPFRHHYEMIYLILRTESPVFHFQALPVEYEDHLRHLLRRHSLHTEMGQGWL